MLVIDEAFDMWNEQKNPNDYHLWFHNWWKKDIENMVLRDRNHPSVVMWSIGNEIPNRQKPEVVQTAKMLADFIRNIDPTRPITSAVNDLNPDKDPYFATLDIGGYNYASGGDHNQAGIYAQDHIRVPERIMVGTESFPLEAFGSWMDVVDHPYVIGDFVWTAFDYIGEASIGWRGYWQKQDFFPWNLAYCGDIDICGWKRPQSYYRDALWKENQLSIWVTPPEPSFEPNPERQDWSKWHWLDAVDDWNWKGSEGKTMEVSVYSSCEQVELFLNGKSLGKKPTNRTTKFIAVWQVPYQPGTLKAVGFTKKKQVIVSELKTAGEPVNIKFSADRTQIKADGQDLSYITIELTDANGIRNPKSEKLVRFEIEGPGTIVGVGNANPISLESCLLPERKAWKGKCLVIVKSEIEKGTITLKASSPGLNPVSIEIESN
jgi:beta-galactosidase